MTRQGLAWAAGLWLLAGVVCLPAATAAEVRELLANGGFEAAGAQGEPENWGLRNWGEGQFVAFKVTGGAAFGQRCLELRGLSTPILYGCFSHPIDLGEPPPTELLLTLHYRTQGDPGAEVAVMSFAEDFAAQEWKTPVIATDMLGLEPAGQWRSAAWHVRLMPSARQITVVARIHGQGAVLLDGMSLKAYPAEVECRLLEPALVTSLKGGRECRVRLTNHTAEDLPLRLDLQAEAPKGPKQRGNLKLKLGAGKTEEVALGYSYPLDKAPEVSLTVASETGETIHDRFTLVAPGLIDGRVLSPPFRGTILQNARPEAIIARGRVNAAADLRGQLTLQARIAGLGLDLPAPPLDADGNWEIRTPIGGMLTGNYAVHLTASQAGRQVGELSLPLLKPAPKGSEACYDERMRLWVGDQMRLPLGVFFAIDDGDFAVVSQAGFNTVVLPSRLAHTANLAVARELGLTVIISSPSIDRDFWQNLHSRHVNETQLAGWYLAQRPDLQSPPIAPMTVASAYAGVSQIDPRHPACLAVGSLSRLQDYAPFCDILMPWTDPEPVGDLRPVDAMLKRALEITAGEKPVWPLIQMTGGAYATDSRLDPEGNGRPPSAQEYRCMAYLALARGATGVFSYAFRVPQGSGRRDYCAPRDAPQLWEGVGKVNQELRAITPVLLEGEPFAVEGDGGGVALRGLRYRDVYYVLAANPQASPAVLNLKIPGMRTDQLEVAFAERKVVGTAPGEFIDQIEPYGARVYMGR